MLTSPQFVVRPASRRALLSACFLSLLFFLACGEQRHEQFASGLEALSSDTAKRGWIPSWLPTQAREVNVRYDLDTNYVWLSFRLNTQRAVELQSYLRPVNESFIRSGDLRVPRATRGWPEGVIQPQFANENALNATLFRGAGTIVSQNTFVAFKHTTDAVFVWIPYDDSRNKTRAPAA